MLQRIRDGVKGWLAYAIVAVIAVPFVFVGGYSYFSGDDGRVVAEVDGDEIPRERVEQVFHQQRERLERAFDGELPEGVDDRQLRRRALEEVIDQTLMQNYVRRHGFRISDQQVAQHIRNQELFQVGGEFSRERYRNLLRQNRLTPEQYEELVRQDLMVEQFQEAVLGSAAVSSRSLDRFIAVRDQSRDFRFVQWRVEDFLDEVEVQDDEVEAYYQANRERFMEPEAVRLRYIELTPAALGEELEPDQETLRSFYEQRRGAWEEGGRREARHILLELDEDADAEERAAVMERAEELRERLRDGEPFDELAATYSQDPGSAEEGGRLGWLERGDTVEPFEEALFALAEGEISEPVVSDFGVHLIRVDGIEAGEAPAFEEVRDEIEREWLEDRVGNELFELGDEIANIAFEQPDSLEPAAGVADLSIQTSDWIPREGTGSGLGQHAQVVDAAFHPEVLEQGYNSDLIEISSTRFVVVRLDEHREAAPQPLEEVAHEVRAELRQVAAREKARERAEAFREQAAADDGAWEELAERMDGEVVSASGVGRGTAEYPGSIMERAFRIGEGELGLIEGDRQVSVLQVQRVEAGDPMGLSATDRQRLRQQLLTATARQELASVVRALRADANIRYRREDLAEAPDEALGGLPE